MIFINLKQINVTYSYGPIYTLILTYKVQRRLWKNIYIYSYPYTHQKSVIRKKYYIDKRCTNMGGLKNVKNYNEKKGFL